MPETLNDKELVSIAQRLQALAQSGLTYAKDIYDRERYDTLMSIAERMLSSRFDLQTDTLKALHKAETGYATPKTDVRALILNERKVLLVRESDDMGWSLPGGWADVGDSPSLAIIREVHEETGLEVSVSRLLGVWDRNQHGHPPYPWHVYKMIFSCEVTGGELAVSHESLDIGYFDPDNLPELSLTRIVPEEIHASIRTVIEGSETWCD
ncbi:NUDIX hydrolase [Enterobacter cloacae]|uniref:NUDIX hydrolase n=1 Tax=Enterobacter TaxID=547 RepID=UPI000D1D3DD7|nr:MULTISPECIES: NUDIX hydrolase [Enterobacter]HCL8067240.1 NUDIX hydrolase [Escherichia coli]MBJ6387217.1 NUDIX hydrolase [Enterobacter cloacae]MBJ6405289.1 NUDIX hydrolase [Enterobacter cloacae]MBJ6457886.1 NUDIX hydrolase [Enterobacter cloacae]MBJ6484105.1 NUDIX hydrolase [Enterobacter cloacae]